ALAGAGLAPPRARRPPLGCLLPLVQRRPVRQPAPVRVRARRAAAVPRGAPRAGPVQRGSPRDEPRSLPVPSARVHGGATVPPPGRAGHVGPADEPRLAPRASRAVAVRARATARGRGDRRPRAVTALL